MLQFSADSHPIRQFLKSMLSGRFIEMRHETYAGITDPERKTNTKLASENPEFLAKPRIEIKSAAFKAADVIPKKYTADAGGSSASPPLTWSNAPKDTREFVLICEDPDAPRAQAFVHWLVYNISSRTTSLLEGTRPEALLASGAKQSKNSSERLGYTGPRPPPGHGVHRYHFQLFALNTKLQLGLHPDRDTLIEAMQGHVVGVGDLVGTYERK